MYFPTSPRPHQLAAAVAIACSVFASVASATENGGNSYALGVETNLSGVMLPEGLHAFMYYAHYQASHNKDNAGANNPRFAYYSSKSNTLASRLSYVWPGVRLLGANVETRAALSLPTVNLDMGIARSAALGPLDRSGNKTGVGDLQLAPILLGWHDGALHQTAGVETYIPIGQFNKNAAVNIGRNYWQVAPIYAVTWLPERWQLSGKLRYAVNSKNKDTDYRSGNELSFEYSAGYAVAQGLVLGINGYLYRQTTNDRQDGVLVNGNGNRGRVNAAGPFVSYSFTPKLTVIAKLQFESQVRNRPQGTRLWLQTKIPF